MTVRQGFGVAAMLTIAALAGCSGDGGGEQASRNMSRNEVAGELSNVRIEPGQWELTSRITNVTAPDMPRELISQMTRPNPIIRNCITPEQAASPNTNFLTAQQNSNCTYRDFSMRGGRMQGTMSCTAPPEGQAGPPRRARMTATMDGQYGPQSYDLTMHMETPNPMSGGTMRISTRTQGRRVGPCPPGGGGQG